MGCPGDGQCGGNGICSVEGTCQCSAGYTGEDCQISVCANTRAMLPGVATSYFEGYWFDDLRLHTTMPDIGGSYDNGEVVTGSIGSDYVSMISEGFLRTFEGGYYQLRCRATRGDCTLLFNGSDVTVDRQLLISNQHYRFKAEMQHTINAFVFYVEWAGPFLNATGGVVDWVRVPSLNLYHEVVCSGGCSSLGCCSDTGKCSCPAGRFGSSCEVAPVDCGVDGPKGRIEAGGLRMRIYDKRWNDAPASTAYSFELNKTRPNFNWGHGSPIGVGRDQFTVVWVGFLRAPQTGWYNLRFDYESGHIRFMLGGVRRINWVWSASYTVQVFLQSGQDYDVRLDYQHSTSSASIRWYWEGPGFQVREASIDWMPCLL